jgi:hypothetical protein
MAHQDFPDTRNLPNAAQQMGLRWL